MHLFEHLPELGESAYAVTEGEPEDVKIQHYGDPKNLGIRSGAAFSKSWEAPPFPRALRAADVSNSRTGLPARTTRSPAA